MTGAPLAGVRVLDLTRLLPGGYATLLLAELGADVVKVEQPGRGDYIRAFPPYTADGQSALHATLNRGKRSVAIDLSTVDGVAAFRELAAAADVLVESFRPGVAARLGIGYDELRAANPGLVYVAISGYGAAGERAGLAGHDINYLSIAGVLGLTGAPQSGPWQPAVQVADIGGGALPAVIAVLAALRVRDRTGAGQFCDVSMTDGARAWLQLYAATHAVTGQLPRPGAEQLSGGLACYRVYGCADGRQVAVGALEPQFFAQLLDVLGLPELAGWQLDPGRQAELATRIAAAFATRPRDDWAAAFAGVDACVTPVLDLAEALADRASRDRGVIGEQRLPGDTLPALPTAPVLSASPAPALATAPGLGEHTAAVFAELGRAPAEPPGPP
jgi:crotonobetainyl-CoA:carnitine CoA-transferase CaiB-like acyl-CoA transferase